MPGKTSGGVKQYVGRNNAGQDDAPRIHANGPNQIFEDLRFDTRLPKAPANRGETRRRADQAGDSELAQPADKHRTLCETDTSSIGDASTTPSARPSKTKPPGHSTALNFTERIENDAERSGEESSDEGLHEDGVVDEFDEHVPIGSTQTGLVMLNERQWRMARQIQHELHRHEVGMSLPYIPGDSLPGSTSGQLSPIPSHRSGQETDLPTSAHESTSPQQYQQQHSSTRMAEYRSNGTQQLYDHEPTQHHHHHQDGAVRKDGLIRRPDDVPESLERHVNVTFSYARADKQRLSKRSDPSKPDQISAGPSGKDTSLSTNSAQPASAVSIMPNADDASMEMGHVVHELRPRADAKLKDHVVTVKQEFAPAPQAMAESNKEREGLPGNHGSAEADISSNDGAGAVEEKNLDYDTKTLFKMKYSDLKAQPFDINPQSSSSARLDDGQSRALDEKLQAIAGLTLEEQERFFAHLSLDEWEQAGDWFISQFSNVLEKLKSGRREKREAARGFEDEIEKRDIAVRRKRKQTDDALEGMRESGAKVLEATPKRTRTK